MSRAGSPSEPGGAALAAHAACERTYRELTRSLGQAGAEELLTRAIAIAQAEHPLLKDVRIGRQSTPDLDGVMIAVRAHGAVPVAAALEALLESLLRLLGRLIGDDLVARLVEPSLPNATHDDQDGS